MATAATADSGLAEVNKKLDEVIARAEREDEETGPIIRGRSSFERTTQKEKISEGDTAKVSDKNTGTDTVNEQGQDLTPSLVVKLPVSSLTDSDEIPSLVVKFPISSPTDTIKVSEKRR